MSISTTVSRRRFFGRLGVGLAYAGVAHGTRALAGPAASARARAVLPQAAAPPEEYDGFAKLAFNENPYGPPESVLAAMTRAFRYANRYGYPDGGIVEKIAEHHGVKPENILLGAGSAEILDVVGSTLLQGGRKVIGVEPTFSSVYEHATGIKADAIRLPLLADYRQDIPAMIRAAKTNYRDLGFIYLCNPNNPTGCVVTSHEVRELLDAIPEDVPVLVDEAYHHFVEDPGYATSVPCVLEGRQVIVARTFSKIAGLAGMRLGYGIAPRQLIDRMRPYSVGSINAVVKWGGVAALADVESQQRVRSVTLRLRKNTAAALASLGYPVLPSETNFIMVGLGRRVQPVIDEFRKRGVLVGRPFPPMVEHLRVSIGTADEMQRFMAAFRDILPARNAASG
jgi:histidinol-phosphate aminotransferase